MITTVDEAWAKWLSDNGGRAHFAFQELGIIESAFRSGFVTGKDIGMDFALGRIIRLAKELDVR